MFSNRLLVEGKDDMHVMRSLLKHHGVPENFEMKEKSGIDSLLESLDVELDASDLERLGIIVDADLDLAARWSQLASRLQRLGYSVPSAPEPEGVVIERGGACSVGVWIMPDNALPGMLEHFAGFLVPSGDSMWERARQCVELIPEQDRRFSSDHFVKAHLHTWLAWQADPGTPIGLAITKKYLDAESHHALKLMDWIRRLFG